MCVDIYKYSVKINKSKPTSLGIILQNYHKDIQFIIVYSTCSTVVVVENSKRYKKQRYRLKKKINYQDTATFSVDQ